MRANNQVLVILDLSSRTQGRYYTTGGSYGLGIAKEANYGQNLDTFRGILLNTYVDCSPVSLRVPSRTRRYPFCAMDCSRQSSLSLV